jgi:hypothetical protein
MPEVSRGMYSAKNGQGSVRSQTSFFRKQVRLFGFFASSNFAIQQPKCTTSQRNEPAQ